jgi:hypothetical protein
MKDGDWEEIQVTDLMMDNLSYPVSIEDDGYHYFQLEYRDNEDHRIMDKREIGPIDVYHGQAPMVHERSIPLEGSFLKGSVFFNLTSIDRNQDLVRFIGYCRQDGCPWTIFDRSLGQRNVVLEWNTTYYRPGRYEVKLVAYDGSRLNLTTSLVKGPYYLSSSIYTGKYYFLEDDGSTDEGGGSKAGIIWMVIITFLIVLILSISLVIRKKRKEKRENIENKETVKIIQKQKELAEHLKYSAAGLPQYGASSYYMNMDRDSSSKGAIVEDSEDQDPIFEMGEISTRMDLSKDDISSYDILGVPLNATEDMINSVYLKYIRRFHPDRFQDPNPHLKNMINENIRKKNRARRVLLDPAMRAIIDEKLREDEGELLRSSSTKSIKDLRELMKKGP